MPVIKTYTDKYEFEVTVPETEGYKGSQAYVFLNKKVMVQEDTWTDEDGEECEERNVYAIAEIEELGLAFWNHREMYWEPVEEEIQKAYSNYIAEKELLSNPPKKVKSNVRA
jgi:hypothetical protein